MWSVCQPSAGPAKKSKTASAAAGKPKKAADSKEVAESELAVSVFTHLFSWFEVSQVSCDSLQPWKSPICWLLEERAGTCCC